MFGLTDRFGWTPKQIREIDEEDMNVYLSLIAGESQAEKPKQVIPNGRLKSKINS